MSAAGGAEGPWDHATRLEALAQRFNLHFVGVADPLTEKAAGVVKKRAAGTRGDLYAECNVYDCHQRMMAEAAPDVVRCSTTLPVALVCAARVLVPPARGSPVTFCL